MSGAKGKGQLKSKFMKINNGGDLTDFNKDKGLIRNDNVKERKKELHTNLTASCEPDMSKWEYRHYTQLFDVIGLPQIKTNFPIYRIENFFAFLDEVALLDEATLSDESQCKIFFKIREIDPPRVDKQSFLQVISADGKRAESIPAQLFLALIPQALKSQYPQFRNNFFLWIRAILTFKGICIHGIKQQGQLH